MRPLGKRRESHPSTKIAKPKDYSYTGVGRTHTLLGACPWLKAQPASCDPLNTEMTTTCGQACIICDIDGFSGRHESNVVGSLPADFCTVFVHNAQWIGFQAASTSLEIKLTVSNCSLGYGLEMAIYQSTDCNNFQMISACRGGANPVPPGGSATFTNTQPLVVGQYYYLAMDGNRGDNCDWDLEVIQGSTEVSPLGASSPISGPSEFCVNREVTFSLSPQSGAVIFDWTLNGQPVGDHSNPSVELNLSRGGSYQLCVTEKNACDEALTVCKTLRATEIPRTRLRGRFCQDSCYEKDGKVFCEPGTYEYTLRSQAGCDSVVQLTLIEVPPPVNNLSVNLCQGDTLFIGSTSYTEAGQYLQVLPSSIGCDSTINLDLNLVDCLIQSTYSSTPTICHGDRTGTLSFQVETGEAPFTYTWQHLESRESGQGNIPALFTSELLTSLPAGSVLIEISDDFGNQDVILAQVGEPDPITFTATFSDYLGYAVSCPGATDGKIDLDPAGGWPPYAYLWSTGDTDPNLDGLAEGSYQFSLVDSLGCATDGEFELLAPPLMEPQISWEGPTCQGPGTGSIRVDTVLGGIFPYQYDLNGAGFSSENLFPSLDEGTYQLAIQDENGCVTEQTIGPLIAAQIPEISGTKIYEARLGEELALDLTLNAIAIANIRWETVHPLSCRDCIAPVASPLNSGEAQVLVTSEDGCVDSLSIFISVEKVRTYFVPTGFTPNGDDLNDRFLAIGGPAVASIDLQVFNRWGNLIYSSVGMGPQDLSRAWDGRIKGRPAPQGVYVWQAAIHFLDQRTVRDQGTVTLIR
ncbi:MAG: gliding motility-associated C-terminal domain-containing protein [Bacteroidota bacterium]